MGCVGNVIERGAIASLLVIGTAILVEAPKETTSDSLNNPSGAGNKSLTGGSKTINSGGFTKRNPAAFLPEDPNCKRTVVKKEHGAYLLSSPQCRPWGPQCSSKSLWEWVAPEIKSKIFNLKPGEAPPYPLSVDADATGTSDFSSLCVVTSDGNGRWEAKRK